MDKNVIVVELRDPEGSIKPGWYACHVVQIEGTTTPTFQLSVLNGQDITDRVIDSRADA